jgi:hypothetical protein
MGEEFGLCPNQARKPSPGVTWTLTESLMLARSPSEDMRVYTA